MPYKKEYHTIHCTRCGNDFEVLTPAYMRRLKDPKYGSICPTCRRMIQEEEMTPEEKRLREEKRQKTRAEKRAAMTDEEKEEFARNHREKCQAKWRAKSEEELQAIHDKQSELQHNRIAAMSDERRAEIGRKISETKLQRNQEMSEEERAARKARMQAERVAYWNSRTEEQRQAIIDRLTKNAQELWDKNGDPEKQQAIIDNLRKGSDAYYASLSDEELQQRVEKLQEGNRKWRENMTDEERAKESERLSQQTQAMWDNMTEDQYNEMMRKRQESMEKRLSDPEYRAAYGKALSEGQTRHWANLTEEERAYQLRGLQEFRDSLTDEEREQRRLEQVEQWANKSPEEIAAFGEKVSKGLKQYYASLDEEGHEGIRKRSQESWKKRPEEEKIKYSQQKEEWWANLTEEERAQAIAAQHAWQKERTPEELAERGHAIMSKIESGPTEQELKFRELFHEYHLDDTYHYVYEDKQERNGYSHRWDYGIYSISDDQLVMLVDIDGALFHGDYREYDANNFGSHSDFTRQKTIPDHVRATVLRANRLLYDFSAMVKELQLPYDAFVEERMKQMRFNGFPFPEYRNVELRRSYEDLCNFPGKYGTLSDYTKNAQVGMWLVHHFHPSIYRSHVVGKPSPYEAVQDDVQLRELVENHTLFRNNNDPNKLLQGFDCCEEVPKIHVFSPNHARILIQRYLSEFSTIYDPMCEFSSTLLGTVSLGKRFVGLHYSDVLINESNQLIRWLQSYYPETNAILQQRISIQAMGEVSCMLTRFPGSQQCIFEQSPMKNTPDEFIRQFMKSNPCKRYVFVVPSTEEFRDCVVDTIPDRHDPDWKELVVVIDR